MSGLSWSVLRPVHGGAASGTVHTPAWFAGSATVCGAQPQPASVQAYSALLVAATSRWMFTGLVNVCGEQ